MLKFRAEGPGQRLPIILAAAAMLLLASILQSLMFYQQYGANVQMGPSTAKPRNQEPVTADSSVSAAAVEEAGQASSAAASSKGAREAAKVAKSGIADSKRVAAKIASALQPEVDEESTDEEEGMPATLDADTDALPPLAAVEPQAAAEQPAAQKAGKAAAKAEAGSSAGPGAALNISAIVLPEDLLGQTLCKTTCCWKYEEMEWAYAGEKGKRAGLNDRMSPGDAKTLADVVMHQGLPIPPWQPPFISLTEDLLPCLQPSTVIFLEGDSLELFFDQFHPKIEVPYILISGDSDNPNPARWAEFMNDTKILHWFGFNCDVHMSHTLEKFTCWPLGVSQWDNSREHMQEAFDKGIGKMHWEEALDPNPRPPSKLFLAAWGPSNEARAIPKQHFCTGALQPNSTCAFRTPTKYSRADYYAEIRDHVFVVSPHGMGLDCYRTWETLYLGRYPIVQKSSIDELYSGLPVWVVDRWEDVTLEKAVEVALAFSRKQWQWERLYKGYWQRLVYQYRQGRVKNKRIVYSVR